MPDPKLEDLKSSRIFYLSILNVFFKLVFLKVKPDCLSSIMYCAEKEESKPVTRTFESELPPAVFLTDYISALSNVETGNIKIYIKII